MARVRCAYQSFLRIGRKRHDLGFNPCAICHLQLTVFGIGNLPTESSTLEFRVAEVVRLLIEVRKTELSRVRLPRVPILEDELRLKTGLSES